MRHRFRPLLVSLVLLLLLYPYFEGSQYDVAVLSVLSIAVLLSGVYAISQEPHLFRIACILGSLSILINLGMILLNVHNHLLVVADLSGEALFYGFTTVVILRHVLLDRTVTEDTIFGALAVYLLAGLTWAMLYTFIETVQPGSFHLGTASDGAQAVRWSELLYFSYVTLTTLGYGDITPATAQARSLVMLESVFGVLYLAVLVARLVSIYRPSSHTQEE